jgi:hypothetical protein
VLAPFLRFHPTGEATKPLAGLFPNSCAIKIEEGGRIRHIFFDIGRDQLIAFMEADGFRDVPAEYDADIICGLAMPNFPFLRARNSA